MALNIGAMDSLLHPLLDRIRAAAADGTPLRLRGGGTKDFYGETPAGEVLDTRAVTGISSYEPSELVVTVRGGTPLAELEAALAEQGQCLPFEPPHFGAGATVGGMVAAGLSGPARAAVGSVRDYVLGLRMVNGHAQLLTFGGQVMKNVAGYDLSRLMAGSMGTLGMIAEVSLKVLPFAPAETTLRFALGEAEAIRRLNEWAGQPLPLNASSWVVDNGQPSLYLRLRGARAAVDAACTRLMGECPGERIDSPQVQADWSAARELTLPWFAEGAARGQDLWRLSVPPTAAPLGLGDTMIDWLGAQRWIWATPGDRAAAQRLREAAARAGGHATLWRCADRNTPAVPRFTPLAPVQARIQQALRRDFDPAGVFETGRLGG